MTSEYHIVIPARLASERLPDKVLLDIGGKPMLQRVWERAMESRAASVIVATDHPRIADACAQFGADVQMTDSAHQSGSDRIAEVVTAREWRDDTIVVNLQGDEPMMPSACLEQVAELAAGDPGADAATLYWPISDESEISNPNVVKVVVGLSGHALMFSRSPLPWTPPGNPAAVVHFRHIGLYAYRAGSLLRFSGWQRTPLEQSEKLEQLRFLEHGGRILAAQACREIPPGIDTAEDLAGARKRLESRE